MFEESDFSLQIDVTRQQRPPLTVALHTHTLPGLLGFFLRKTNSFQTFQHNMFYNTQEIWLRNWVTKQMIWFILICVIQLEVDSRVCFYLPSSDKYNTSCFCGLTSCPVLPSAGDNSLTHIPPYTQLPALWMLYSFLRSASLNRILCMTVTFKENILLCHEKRYQSTRFIFVWKKNWKFIKTVYGHPVPHGNEKML